MFKVSNGALLLSLAGLGLGFPLIFFTDCLLLADSFCYVLSNFSPIPIPSFFPTLLASAGCIHVILTLFLTVVKWLKYPIQFVPVVYYVSFKLSRVNGGNPKISIRGYKTIFILVDLLNEAMSSPLISFKFIMVTTVSVAFTIFLISPFSPVSISVFVTSSVMLLVGNAEFSFGTKVNESSTEFIQNLVRNLQVNERERRRRRQVIASLRPCRIYCGTCYFIDRGVILKLNDAVINYTISNLMLLKDIK